MADKDFIDHATLVATASRFLFEALEAVAEREDMNVETVMEVAHSFMAQVVYKSITCLKNQGPENVNWALGMHRKLYAKMEEGVRLLLGPEPTPTQKNNQNLN